MENKNIFMSIINIKDVKEMLEFDSKNKIHPIAYFFKYKINTDIYNDISNIKNNKFEIIQYNTSIPNEQIINSFKNLINNINSDKQYYLLIDEFNNASKQLIKCILELIVTRESGGFGLPSNIHFILIGYDIPNIPTTIINKFVMAYIER